MQGRFANAWTQVQGRHMNRNKAKRQRASAKHKKTPEWWLKNTDLILRTAAVSRLQALNPHGLTLPVPYTHNVQLPTLGQRDDIGAKYCRIDRTPRIAFFLTLFWLAVNNGPWIANQFLLYHNGFSDCSLMLWQRNCLMLGSTWDQSL